MSEEREHITVGRQEPSSILPDEDQALQFVILLSAGIPAEHAILYFVQTEDAGILADILRKWLRSRKVQVAQKRLAGKSWQEMSIEERIDAGLNQQYNNLAYLCHSVNYVTASDRDKGKLDSAIKLLESKKAGTSGQMNALESFMVDFIKEKKKKELAASFSKPS